MKPELWHPPLELSDTEKQIVSRIRRAKLFIFLRKVRHQLFDDEFQQELAKIFDDNPKGQPPVSPAKLALVTILQAYTGASDDEAIESLLMDRRWQLVLDCLDCQKSPLGKGTLVRFRQKMIRQRLDRRLIERTVELAKETKEFGAAKLRAALDSSPLWGAGKVEDTINLLGHALEKALKACAVEQGRELAAIAKEVGGSILNGSSLKAQLDVNWDIEEQRSLALSKVLEALEAVENWVAQEEQTQAKIPDSAHQNLKVARQIQTQDVESSAEGKPKIRRGVAKNRRISVEDGQMRHGRKSRSQRFDGYKRHVLTDLDSDLIRAVGLTPANVPEAWISDSISNDLMAQGVELGELHIDRGYLNSKLVRKRKPDLAIYCKAWPVRNRGGRFSKAAFILDWEQQTITCPNQVTMTFKVGSKVQFPSSHCQECPLQQRCTTSKRGRSVSIHPDEEFLTELRQRQLSKLGRAQLRQRVAVEHSLAHLNRWQGNRARYIGLRKNLFDLRRTAVVHNLHVWSRFMDQSQSQSPRA
jgi:hypothetical protein